MAEQHPQFVAAGARLVGVSVDSVGQNAAMVGKLDLPFPLLSDPDGEGAIRPYDVWHGEQSIARPAIVVVAPDFSVAFRRVSSDFADRPLENDLVDEVGKLGLAPTVQDRPEPGTAEPGKRAVDLAWLPAYLRGAKFAVTALATRVPQAVEQAETLKGEYDHYIEVLKNR